MRLTVAIISAIFLIAASPAFAACGPVSIGAMNWNSARVIAQIEKIILQAGYGCSVSVAETSTVPGLTKQIEVGRPDILSETWVSSVKQLYERGIAEGKIVAGGKVLLEGGIEGWWIPSYLAQQHPDLKTVEDLKRKWALFKDPDVAGKGRFYTCPIGWGCQIINANLFKAYGLDSTYRLYNPGSGEKLNLALAEAYNARKPWVGYYWGPTAILGRYPMVRLQLNPADVQGHKCNQRKDCETPHAGSYPASKVVATTTAKFKRDHAEAFDFIAKLSIPNRIMNGILAWGEKNRRSAPDMARQFLRTERSLWTSWLPADAVKKIDAAL